MESDAFRNLRRALERRYEIGSELGRGGAAFVFLARDVKTGQPVAIKLMRPEFASALTIRRFLLEIQTASRLSHPNILSVFDSGEVDGLPYYLMPFVEGGSLQDLLDKGGPLSIDRTLAIVDDVASALDYAHRLGIAHRDIKPANILFRSGRAVVSDFGIARAFSEAGGDRLTESGVVIGTPAYTSPEQAGSERQIDGRSDVYALGCVVFAMLAGEPPFTGASPKVVLARHMQERPPRLSIARPTVPVEMELAVERALAKQRADRFQTAGEFAAELRRSATGATARARRLRRYAAVVAAAAVVATSGASLVRLVGAGHAADPGTDALRRVAVLYFDDLTPEKRLSHVAAGLTEDLIDELSEVRALKVVSPNGVRPFRDSALALDSLARRLNVGTMITGSVAASGALWRFTVRLIDPRTGVQLQSRSLERPPWNVLNAQDSLTTEVALWLRERLGGNIRLREQRRATKSAEAWEDVKRGEAWLSEGARLVRTGDTRARATLLRADSALAAAEGRDPSWITPTADRARVALALAFTEAGPGISPEATDARFVEHLLHAVNHADRGLVRYPRAPEALAIRGEARLRLATLTSKAGEPGLLDRAAEDLRQAVTLRPDYARAWAMLGDVYFTDARFSDAADAYTTALETDAFLTEIRTVVSSLFLASLYAERFDDAAQWCTTGSTRYPGDPRFVGCKLMLLGARGDHPRDATAAWEQVEQIEREDSSGMHAATWAFRRMMVAAVLARCGLKDSSLAVLRRTASESAGRPPAAPAEAYVRVLLGDHDRALAILRSEAAVTPSRRNWIARVPWYLPLHGDQRFHDIVSDPDTETH